MHDMFWGMDIAYTLLIDKSKQNSVGDHYQHQQKQAKIKKANHVCNIKLL